MRWFRRGRQEQQVDPAVQGALFEDVRRNFGGHVRAPFADQAQAAAKRLDGDDGLLVAAGILRQYTDDVYRDMSAQAARLGYTADRRNYRPLWSTQGARLRWSFFVVPSGLHPYAHVTAAAIVLGQRAKRFVRLGTPQPALAHVYEVLDLVVDGWEWGRVRVDADAATLASALITAGREVGEEMGDPPPLPPPVREMMRRNNTIDVLDPAAERVIGTFNPGKTMREVLLA